VLKDVLKDVLNVALCEHDWQLLWVSYPKGYLQFEVVKESRVVVVQVN
jgi:hypothetical protein